MDYAAALRDLRGRIPTRMAPDLDRIRAVADLLGDPQLAYPSVHVTGTNGKSSVARMLTALFAAVGLSAGTYTSPHLQDIRERLSAAGRPIGERAFARVYGQILPVVELVDAQRPGGETVTYFEMLTALAYAWFADLPIDVGVFEVGMGGTWDATNLVRGEVAVLNTVDVDHRELGSTPGEVAGEKAGIIKPGSVAVSAAQPPDALDVISRTAAERDAHLLLAGQDFGVTGRAVAVGGQMVGLRTPRRSVGDVMLPLHGAHQAANAALALAAFEEFLGDAAGEVADDLIREAFAAVQVPGRLEVVHRHPTVVLDGAHNPHGAATLADGLDEAFAFRNLILVAASLSDKDITGILRPFRELADHVVVTQAPSQRGAPLQRMAELARDVWAGTPVIVETAPDVARALELATGVAGDGDGVLVTGSLYTVGAARDLYRPSAARQAVTARE